MTLFEAAARRQYLAALDTYEGLRKRHRKRRKAYQRLQDALHTLMRAEIAVRTNKRKAA